MKKLRCEKCNELLDSKKAKWLEFSITDGNYYTTLPKGHISQGWFSFGTICATKQINETLAAISKNSL